MGNLSLPMVYDINLKIRDLGDVCGSFRKATQNHVYLSNAIIAKTPSIVISSFKVEKKYITSVTRVTKPYFELFTDEQLAKVSLLNNSEYTQMAQKILEQRKSSAKQSSAKQKTEQAKIPSQSHSKHDKKDWNQFEENKKRFGVESIFEVDEYASPIDKNAPNFNQAQEKAKKYLRENMHNEASLKKTESKDAHNSEDLMYSTVQKEDKWGKVVEENKIALTPEQIRIQDLKKQLDEVNKDLENLQKSDNFGWSKIPSLVSRKNALNKEINSILNPTIEEVKPLPVDENISKPKNESNEPAKNKQAHGEIKEGEPNKNMKTSEKSNASNQKKKNHQPEIPASFSSASQIVECILKNLKVSNKPIDGWNSTTGFSREGFLVHFKPLEIFDFPQEEIISAKQKSASFNHLKLSK